MLTTDRCRQLVAESRSLIEQSQGVTFPALEPPATEVELAAAEERIGVSVPDDLKALYQMTGFAGPLTAFDLSSLDHLDEGGQIVRTVMEELDSEGLLADDPDERSERSYRGDKPQGNFMSFGRVPTELRIEVTRRIGPPVRDPSWPNRQRGRRRTRCGQARSQRRRGRLRGASGRHAT